MNSTKTAHSEVFTRRSFVKIASVGTASIALFSLPKTAFAEERRLQRQFVDSLGRSVVVAGTIENVTPVGVYAQTLMATLCPEGLVSLAANIDADAADYNEAGIGGLTDLPETGGIASPTTEEVAVEEIEAISPELILDVGLPKEGLADELDTLQSKTGIPVVFLDISFGNLSSAYRALGELLVYQARAEQHASYIDQINGRVRSFAANSTTGSKVFYAPREDGLMARSGIEVQLDAVSFVGATPVTAPYDCANKTVNLDALEAASVDLVVFDDTTCLDSLLSAKGEAYEIWKDVAAIAQGRYAISPALMHSWFGSAVLVQTLGVLWLSSILWPTERSIDLALEAQTFYSLFYGLEKDASELVNLIGDYNGEGCSDDQ